MPCMSGFLNLSNAVACFHCRYVLPSFSMVNTPSAYFMRAGYTDLLVVNQFRGKVT